MHGVLTTTGYAPKCLCGVVLHFYLENSFPRHAEEMSRSKQTDLVFVSHAFRSTWHKWHVPWILQRTLKWNIYHGDRKLGNITQAATENTAEVVIMAPVNIGHFLSNDLTVLILHKLSWRRPCLFIGMFSRKRFHEGGIWQQWSLKKSFSDKQCGQTSKRYLPRVQPKENTS